MSLRVLITFGALSSLIALAVSAAAVAEDTVPIEAQDKLPAPKSINEPPSPHCVIKGDVDGIYYLPGQPSYERFDIDQPEKRWFCSQEEAKAAGWRSSHKEKEWEPLYCKEMERETSLPSGGRVDCLSAEYAIEVEWAQHWAEGVGQSLYYAAATERKPGIILLCEESEGPVEGLCRSYVYRLEYALKFVNTHVYVWTCAIDKDVELYDCFRPEIQPTTELNSAVGR
jgi:hypothetical protein